MGILLLIIFIVLLVASMVFIGAASIYLLFRIFKVEDLKFSKTLQIYVCTILVSLAATVLLSFIPSSTLADAISAVLSFVIPWYALSFFTKRHYAISWKKILISYVVLIVVQILLVVAIALPIRQFVATPFLVSGRAMSPAYQSGDYLFINKFDGSFVRGDVVVFDRPQNSEQRFIIERIVGLPGETVRIVDGGVEINGMKLQEPYAVGETAGDLTFPLDADEYFMLGDNREISNDSRYAGPVQRSLIVGKIWFYVGNF